MKGRKITTQLWNIIFMNLAKKNNRKKLKNGITMKVKIISSKMNTKKNIKVYKHSIVLRDKV